MSCTRTSEEAFQAGCAGQIQPTQHFILERSGAQPTKRRTSGSHRKLLAIVERDGLDCIYCGTVIPLEDATREHFVALSRGGPDTPENTVIACKDCNMAVGSMTVKQKIEYALSKRLKSGDSNGKEN